MCIQAIVMPDRGYDRYLHSVDFIQRYVFPGSCLPSLGAIVASTARATDLRVTDLEDIAPHYAETLRRWRIRFFEKIDAVRALGYPERFVRLWHFYLTYCEAGFDERAIGDLQIVLAKPEAREDGWS
jgi:cyclopropane-fatty-acyl-phospholipid synthase